MRRRELLAGAGTAVGGLVAGCVGPGDENETPTEEIVRFSVTNEDDVQRSISIEVQQNGEVVAAGTGELLPTGEQETPFRYGFPSVGTPVSAVIQSDNGSKTVQWDPAACAELQVDVRVVDGEPQTEEACQ